MLRTKTTPVDLRGLIRDKGQLVCPQCGSRAAELYVIEGAPRCAECTAIREDSASSAVTNSASSERVAAQVAATSAPIVETDGRQSPPTQQPGAASRPTPGRPRLQVLGELLYRDREIWLGVPEWADLFAWLGRRLVRPRKGDKHAVIALSLPTRAYAAAFAAYGAVLGQVELKDEGDHEARFWAIAEQFQDHGSPLPVRLAKGPNREVAGQIKELREEKPGLWYLVVQIGTERQGFLTELISPPLSGRIRVVDQIGPIGRHSMVVRHGLDFLQQALRGQDARLFLRTTSLACSIVGPRGALHDEICGMPFGFRGTAIGASRSVARPGVFEGRLNDLIRARPFLASGSCYRTEIVQQSSGSLFGGARPPLVILDGAKAATRWGVELGCPVLVLLDRSDSHFEEGIAGVNDAHSRRVGDADDLKLPGVPSGVQILRFEARAN